MRPLLTAEGRSSWNHDSKTLVGEVAGPNGKQAFTFDHVYGQDDETGGLYDGALANIVSSTISGFNGTIFAYAIARLRAAANRLARGGMASGWQVRPNLVGQDVHDARQQTEPRSAAACHAARLQPCEGAVGPRVLLPSLVLLGCSASVDMHGSSRVRARTCVHMFAVSADTLRSTTR